MAKKNVTSNPPRSSAEQRDAAAGEVGAKPHPMKYVDAAPCEGPDCKNIVPAGMYSAMRTRTFCCDLCRGRWTNSHYREAARSDQGQAAVSTPDVVPRDPTKYTKCFEAAACEGPGCVNVVPAGVYSAYRKRNFCSNTCRSREREHSHVIGTCLCGCGEPLLGPQAQAGTRKFVSQSHFHRYTHERQLGDTGPFRPVIEWYISAVAKTIYSPSVLGLVRGDLARLCRFAVQEGLSDINQFTPSTITKFLIAEHDRGVASRTCVGRFATFFNCLREEGRYGDANPVIPRRHYQNAGSPGPRPYDEGQLTALWARVEATGKHDLMLAFWIGVESGLRIGEVCNIRLSDVDARAQKIFVRLPTKNGRTRSVPFHDNVQRYLALWLEHRSRYCPTDHLLHNKADHPFSSSLLGTLFTRALGKGEPAFGFHRLRHSWATRLMNNGMELAVLKELGGWMSWSAMQGYIKVLDVTIRRQYEAAYTKLQEKQESPNDESLSLLDFASMDCDNPATALKSAA